MIDSRFPALSTTIVASVLWRTGGALATALANAWPASSTARLLEFFRAAMTPGSFAAIAAIAVTLWMLLQRMIPEYVRSILPWFWPVAVAATAAVLAMNARAVARAWPASAAARLFTPRHER